MRKSCVSVLQLQREIWVMLDKHKKSLSHVSVSACEDVVSLAFIPCSLTLFRLMKRSVITLNLCCYIRLNSFSKGIS